TGENRMLTVAEAQSLAAPRRAVSRDSAALPPRRHRRRTTGAARPGVSAVRASPCAEGLEHRSEGLAFVGEVILVAGGMPLIEAGGDHALGFQHLEASRQCIRRHPR